MEKLKLLIEKLTTPQIIAIAVLAALLVVSVIVLAVSRKKNTDGNTKSDTAEQPSEKVKAAEQPPEKVKAAEQASEKVKAAEQPSEKVKAAAEQAPEKAEAAAEQAPEKVKAAAEQPPEKVKAAEQPPEKVKAAAEQAPEKVKAAEQPPEKVKVAEQPPEKVKTAAAEQPPVEKKETEKTIPSGKFEISIRNDGYHFSLIASNGQLLYDSYGFSGIKSALSGIETFKKAVNGGNFTVYEDKFGRYRFVLNKRYAGENYKTKTSCENSVNSVKRFAQTAIVVPYTPDEEAEKIFAAAKKNMKTVSDEEWAQVAAKEYKPNGKYEIEQEDDGFHFYLVANNGQLLYSGRPYTTAAGAAEGINSFKRAVYTGNFYVDEDKFGKFRYILRGVGGTVIYTGESFTTKKSAQNNVESVKNFALTAVINQTKSDEIQPKKSDG